MSEAEPKFCATCGEPLNSLTNMDTGEEVYFHARELAQQAVNHGAAPVSADQLAISKIMPLCDFCSRPLSADEVHTFECPDLNNARIQANSRGPWAACPDCRDLVLADDHEGLLTRSVEHYLSNRNLTPSDVTDDGLRELRRAMGSLHKAFFAHRTGVDYPGLPEGLR